MISSPGGITTDGVEADDAHTKSVQIKKKPGEPFSALRDTCCQEGTGPTSETTRRGSGKGDEMKKGTFTKALLAITALTVVAGISSAGEPRGIEVYPFEYVPAPIYIDCLGEIVQRTVSGETRFHTFETAKGVVHVIDNWMFTVYAVGAVTGRIWVGHAKSPYQSNVRLETTGVEQFISRIRFKPLDEGSPMWMWENQFKITVNANGDVVAFHPSDDPSYEGTRCLPNKN